MDWLKETAAGSSLPFKLHLFVDEGPSSWQGEQLQVGRISEDALRKQLSQMQSSKTLLLVCGPEPCVVHSSSNSHLTIELYRMLHALVVVTLGTTIGLGLVVCLAV
jgi:hypothetical protein